MLDHHPTRDPFLDIARRCRATCDADLDRIRVLPATRRLADVRAGCAKLGPDRLFEGPLAPPDASVDAFEYLLLRELLGELRRSLEASAHPAAPQVWPRIREVLPGTLVGMKERVKTPRRGGFHPPG